MTKWNRTGKNKNEKSLRNQGISTGNRPISHLAKQNSKREKFRRERDPIKPSCKTKCIDKWQKPS